MADVTPNGGGGSMPDLFAKVGPLPAWAWGAIAVGGYLWWSHQHAATAVPAGDGNVDTTDTSSVPDVSSSNDYGYSSAVDPSSAGYDYSTVNSGDYSGTTTGTAFTSNQEWGVKAITTLVSAGVPASTATSGVTLYLAGSGLTADQANAVNEAIVLIGPPPLPMPVNLITSTTPTQPTTTPVDTTPTNDPAPTPVVGTTPTPVTDDPTPTGATTVPKPKPSVSLSVSPSTVKVGQAITFTIHVSGSYGTPTGEVFVSPEVDSLRAQLVNGQASIVFHPTRLEHVDTQAGYEGDNTYDYAASNRVTFDVK